MESRKLCALSTLTFGLILALLFAGKASVAYSRIVLVGAWLLSIFLLPVTRRFCRHYFGKFRWWGTPLVILDRSNTGRELWHYLKRHPWLGLSPVDIFTLPPDMEEARRQLKDAERRHPGAIALMLQPSDAHTARFVHEASRYFVKILVVPAQSSGVRQHWFHACDLGTMTGFMLMQNLRRRWRQRLKRALDLVLCLPVVVLCAVPGLLLCLLIRLDSRGPVFYRQRRLGKDGKPFKTREGGVMRLEHLIADIDAAVYDRIMENRSMDEAEAKETAKIVGLAALKYGDLSNQAAKDYVFDIDRFISFEGNTGPYILYTIVRIKSILGKYEAQNPGTTAETILPAASDAEKTLMLELSKYNDVMENAFAETAPHKICQYIFDLSNAFNSFYHDTRILAEEDKARQASWIALITLVKRVLEACIQVLGFEAPERM